MMKDITRIHIAKVPYSIELTAKHQLEAYIKALEAYTDDKELLQDIEIRITELLLERGVKQEEVIAETDVTAIREQLGEPKEFMTDEVISEVDAETLAGATHRRLYRNLDSAIIGGVLSGAAHYLRINALWVRLAYIILVFISFGVALLLYVLAWLIVPPARTAAEKLQMAGRPVTLSSIRELNDSGAIVNYEKRAAIIKRILTTCLGTTALFAALAAIAAIAIVSIQLIQGIELEVSEEYKIPLILMFISGGLFVVLALLVAIASFTQKFNKRIWISGAVIIALGLLTSITAITMGGVQQQLRYQEMQRNTVTVTEELPPTFEAVTALRIDSNNQTNVNYIVDTNRTSFEQTMQKGTPKANVSVENGVATVSLDEPLDRPYFSNATVTIHGPVLENIVVNSGYMTYINDAQDSLKIEATNDAAVTIVDSRITAVEVVLDKTARFDGGEASISAVTISLSGRSDARLGNIKELTVKSPESCATNAAATLSVENILSASYDYNGTQAANRSMISPCTEVTITGEDETFRGN